MPVTGLCATLAGQGAPMVGWLNGMRSAPRRRTSWPMRNVELALRAGINALCSSASEAFNTRCAAPAATVLEFARVRAFPP